VVAEPGFQEGRGLAAFDDQLLELVEQRLRYCLSADGENELIDLG
jgi:hypothetical protein